MVGRGAIGKPWIFHQMKEGLESVTDSFVKEIVLEHYDQMIKFYGDYGAILFRKHLHTYSKGGYMGASAFRNAVNTIDDTVQMRDIIDNFFSQSTNREF